MPEYRVRVLREHAMWPPFGPEEMRPEPERRWTGWRIYQTRGNAIRAARRMSKGTAALAAEQSVSLAVVQGGPGEALGAYVCCRGGDFGYGDLCLLLSKKSDVDTYLSFP